MTTFYSFVGIVFIVIITCKLLRFFIDVYLSIYGRKIGYGVKWSSDNNEYVVIVGATGQIGTEYAREFASMGFNLVLISRNEEKLKLLKSEYRAKYRLNEVLVALL